MSYGRSFADAFDEHRLARDNYHICMAGGTFSVTDHNPN